MHPSPVPPRLAAGWTGDDCLTVMKRLCAQRNRETGFEQWGGAPNYTVGGLTLRCSGACDTVLGACYCPAEDAFGRLEADPKDPPGAQLLPGCPWLAGRRAFLSAEAAARAPEAHPALPRRLRRL